MPHMTRQQLEAQGKVLFQRRDNVLSRMQSIVRGAEEEGRPQTPAEKAEYPRLDAELCQLD